MRLCSIIFLVLFQLYLPSVHSQNVVSIDYDELGILDKEKTLEIGANEKYIPGDLKDLIVTPSGYIIISDIQKKTIEQFDRQGNHIATIAHEGKGPGELPSYFDLIDIKNNRFLVWHDAAQRLDFYKLDKTKEVYRYSKSKAPDNFIKGRLDIIGPYSKDKFYAFTGHSDKTLIKVNTPEYRMTPISIVSESLKVIQDSLHMIKTANTLFGKQETYNSNITMDGLTYLGVPPYRFEDRFLLTDDNSYMIARAKSSSLFFYNENHKVQKKVTLEIERRPIEPSDLKFALTKSGEKFNHKINNELKRHVRNEKPPFLNVWTSEDHIWLHIDNSKRGKEMVLLKSNGEPVGKFWLSNGDEVKKVKQNQIFTIHEDSTTGYSARVYRLEI